MKLLLDTNILLRLAQTASADHAAAKSAILSLAAAQVELCVVPQVIYEFWVVATRPYAVNGLGMDIVMAEQSVLTIIQDFQLLRDERGIFGHWQTLVVTNSVSGKTAHDARLVAAMQRHGLTNILTFNTEDFVRFPGIHVFAPAEVLAGRLPT
jgi:predicted nucleic acid-binding protein